MTIKASKFDKFRQKIENKLIGNYGSDTGLGTDLIIMKYEFTVNNYDEKSLQYVSQQTCKGIIIDSNDYQYSQQQRLTFNASDVILLIPIGIPVNDTTTEHYEFILNNKTYVLSPHSNAIGQVSNLTGVVRQIILSPKD